MKAFAELYRRIDATTSTNAKVVAMAEYFRIAPPVDAAWALYFLSGRRLRRLVPTRTLRRWGAEMAGIPSWLFEESYTNVGDLAETLALVLDTAAVARSSQAPAMAPPAPQDPSAEPGSSPAPLVPLPLHRWVEERLLPLRRQDEETQRRRVMTWWAELGFAETFLLGKLMTGALRVGVSQTLVVRALSEASGLPRAALTHRLMGEWNPSAEFFEALLVEDTQDADLSRPYPFFLAHPLVGEPEVALGAVEEWQLEWKWDGIRGQLLVRGGEVYLWSRGEELVTPRFPEIAEAARWLPPGTVLDGEILAWREGAPLPFAQLQRRIGRKKVGPKILADVPVVFVAYDLLEADGVDHRHEPLERRRQLLEEVVAGAPEPLRLSPTVAVGSWAEAADGRGEARQRRVEGLMIKRRDAPYGIGRRRGPWWKWKVDPHTVDAVMIYAQAGHGRRATLFTDYTFAVWRGKELIPIAKAYSGLSDEEIATLDRWIRRHTRERFGPVRSVEAQQVFEIAFEGIARSKRHKSGVALRFPRIVRWRRDKAPEEAETLDRLEALLSE